MMGMGIIRLTGYLLALGYCAALCPAAPVEERQAIEEQTATLRGLKFQSPVRYKSLDRAQFREFLLKKVREQFTEQEMRDYTRSLVAMELIPAGTDLLEVMLSMYDEQVAAFYDPDERTLWTFKDATFSRNLDKMLLAHELTHVLQDQNYDFRKFPLKVKDNDDQVLAAMALLEGDATVLMTRWFMTHVKTENLFEDLGAMMKQNTTKLLAAPPFLRETLLFPYLRGQEYVLGLGADGLDAAFRKLPASTEQILHPGNRDEPRHVQVPEFTRAGWRRIGNNVLGEFGIEVLLRESVGAFRAQLAATGWGGDRYHVYEHGTNGPTAVIWATEWDTPRDAEEFADVYQEFLQKHNLDATIGREGSRVVIRRGLEAP
jgi:hypothetical protein